MLATNNQERPFINIEGRKRRISVFLYNSLCVATFGGLYMLFRYLPRFKFYLLSSPCNLSEADCVIVTSHNGKREFIDILIYDSFDALPLRRYTQKGKARVIDSQFSRLIYDFTAGKFVLPPGHGVSFRTFDELYENEISKSSETEKMETMQRNIFYGKNITSLPVPTILDILVKNTFSATLLLNAICILVWKMIEYTKYAVVMGILMMYSFVFTNWEEISHAISMRRLINRKTVKVLKNGRFKKVDSQEVYPGNIVYIEPCKGFACDALVIKGDAITNECLLTGETVPIYKTADQPSIVYSGTDVLKSINTNPTPTSFGNENLCRVRNLTSKNKPKTVEVVGSVNKLENFAIGLVVKTGFQTARGQILKNILNPKPVRNRFVEEAELVIWGTVGLAMILGIVIACLFKAMNFTAGKNLVYSLDLFFTLSNPALPTYLKLGTQLCYKKLINRNIHCNNLNKIHLAGRIDTAVFDKTGTLTCEGLDFLCIDNLVDVVDNIGGVDMITRMGLSTCHLVYELDGKYAGDTLDVKMFIFSASRLVQHPDNTRSVVIDNYSRIYGPILKEYNDNEEMVYYQKSADMSSRNDFITGSTITDDEYTEATVVVDIDMLKGNKGLAKDKRVCGINYREEGYDNDPHAKQDDIDIVIVKTYEFDSTTMRMSVIADDGRKKYVFTKGSPESIQRILRELPAEYEDRTKKYSLDGYRVISLAYKEISESIDRESDESHLNFLSLIVFSNKLKPDSKRTIEGLNRANIRSVMCTGDNILTAISVAKECGIVEEFTPVIFPVLKDNGKSVFDVDWLCIGDEEEFMFDKVRLSLYRGNDRVSHNEFVVACEGREFDFFKNTQYFQFILEKGAVFARFNPGQKKAVIESLRVGGRITMFCGDGANDSGALSSADVGLALAQNEASLAASFTSTEIAAVLDLIREGRSAFVTSVATFKYVVSSCVIAYLALLCLVLRKNFLSDMQTIHSDLLVMLPIAYILTTFDASEKLYPSRPNSFLLTRKDFIPLCVTIGLEGLIIAFLSTCGEASPDLCDQSTAAGLVFFVITFMYIFNGMYLSDCTPHRQGIRSNTSFKILISVLFMSTVILVALLYMFPGLAAAKWLDQYKFVRIGDEELWLLVVSVVLTAFVVFFVQPLLSRIFKRSKNGVGGIDSAEEGVELNCSRK